MKERNLEQKKTLMRIDLIRHGMTRGNEERRYIGITDEPVLEEDQEQLKKDAYIYCRDLTELQNHIFTENGGNQR